MAKLKDISTQIDGRQLSSSISGSQAVTSVEDVDMFNNVMGVTEESATQSDDGQNAEQEMANEQGRSVQKTAKTEEESEAKSTTDEEDVKLSEAEQKEIDDQKINIQELARQLNVMLDQTPVPVQRQQVKLLPKGTLGPKASDVVAKEGESVEVDPELIRRVDVKTLKEQMELAMKSDGSEEKFPEVPDELKSKIQDVAAKDLKSLESTHAESADLKAMLPHMNLANQSEAKSDEETDSQELISLLKTAGVHENKDVQENPEIFEKPEVVEQKREDVVDYLNLKGPDVILNVVSAVSDVESVYEKFKDMQGEHPVIDALNQSSTPLHKDTLMSFIAEQFVRQHDGSDVFGSQSLSGSAQATASQGVQSAFNVLGETMMQPAIQKISSMIMNMAKDGKSGMTRVQIYPPELGSVNIKFQIKDGSVKAEIITQQEATKRIIEKSMPELKNIFSDENLNVESFTVQHSKEHFETPQQKLVTTFSQQQNNVEQNGHQNSNYRNEAKSEQMRRLQTMIAERRAIQAPDRFEVTV